MRRSFAYFVVTDHLRDARRGTLTTVAHVRTPTNRRASRAATPTARRRYIRKIKGVFWGGTTGASIWVTPERHPLMVPGEA